MNLTAKNVSKIYITGDIKIEALKDLSFKIESVSFVSFVGPSGSGNLHRSFSGSQERCIRGRRNNTCGRGRYINLETCRTDSHYKGPMSLRPQHSLKPWK